MLVFVAFHIPIPIAKTFLIAPNISEPNTFVSGMSLKYLFVNKLTNNSLYSSFSETTFIIVFSLWKTSEAKEYQ
ncbi:hypothetical protein NW739_04380 [Mycoplasmopsis felis]|uniref:hypothetical protein n=1 Tax=Mycoplasmopsis felis TaxID=33923 RepID=UPI0021E03247|nr:hypothetical protein [Mycoplasmopsis felis]MCU9939943.1 hypothetical protein [Mycoplasmopsis felis]